MSFRKVAPLLAGIVAMFSAMSTLAAETVPQCALRLLDDRGLDVEKPITICREDLPDACLEPGRSENTSLQAEVTTVYRLEGERHGPVTARPDTADDGTCTITVPRKASVEIAFDADAVRGLTASFYRLDEDRELRRATDSVAIDRPATIRLAAGPYLLSLAARGWAPDLRVLHASPGAVHSLKYRRLDGWSVVLRMIADDDETPVLNAEIEVWSLPGFDAPGRDDPQPRRLLRQRSDADGLVTVSGLRVPMAVATVRHDRFVDTRLPAIASEIGTFRVFEARLHSGGRLEARITREGRPAADARCELTSSDLEEVLFETRADLRGECRLAKIPAGRHALRVTLADEAAAQTVQPLVITDGETSATTVELRPITVSGRVYRGDRGAPGYQVVFSRTDGFDLDAAIYPVGRATTDEDGDYELVVWAAGDYLAQVRTESTSSTEVRFVPLEHDDTLDFQLAAAEVEGRVVDDSGTPRPDAAVTVRWLTSLRSVVLDADARFRVPFHEGGGVAELQAREPGFHPSEPVTVRIASGLVPEPVTLVLRRRDRRVGRVVLASGHPAAGAWVRVYRLDPDGVPAFVERAVADASGRIEVPAESGLLRLFHGGPGCPLGMLDLAPVTDDTPFELRCRQPSHLLVRLVSEEPDLRARTTVLLRRGEVVVPPEVLRDHLHTLGLPSSTDGQGRLGLVALEPGSYDLFHGKGTSVRNLAHGYGAAYLTSISLGVNETVEMALTVDLRH